MRSLRAILGLVIVVLIAACSDPAGPRLPEDKDGREEPPENPSLAHVQLLQLKTLA